MARVKICPKCGAENSPSSSFCINENCGWDISGIKSMDREALARQREAAGAAPAAEPREEAAGTPESPKYPDPAAAPGDPAGEASLPENAVPPGKAYAKICPKCGQVNKAMAKQCSACHENIKFLMKTLVDKSQLEGASAASPAAEPAREPENEVIAYLNAPDGRCVLEIDTLHPVTMIGREHAMGDYLAGRDYTSRFHAEIHVTGKRIALADKGKNGTYINDVKMPAGSTSVLNDGDRVSMGDRWRDDWTKSLAGCFIVAYKD